MAGCEFAVLVAEKGCFVGQYRKVGANRKLFAYRKLAFEDSKARLVQTESFLVCRIGWRLRIAKKGL